MLVTESRPRTLKWFHAGPLLFGDWGTSRLYVLGLAFFYAGHASVWFLAVMSLIMIGVAWAYAVICRCFPDGGGVYSAARQLHPMLAVVGATLLLCGYIITASLSVLEAFHYFGASRDAAVGFSIAAMMGLGALNWFGARSAGRFALGVAVAAVAASLVIAVLAVPYLGPGLRTISAGHSSVGDPWSRWTTLVAIVLALSGVESVANMTGLMRPPVARTAKRTIWPVLIEVVTLNMLFGIALAGLPDMVPIDKPDHQTYVVEGGLRESEIPEAVREYRDTAMAVLATEAATRALGPAVGPAVGVGAAVVFGLLLISAANTAIMAMVSVLFSLGRDGELPRAFTRLNYSGVPWVGVLVAAGLPIGVLLVDNDVASLAKLYAVGVAGAIAINIASCAWNRSLAVGRVERAVLAVIALVMLAVELTIIGTAWYATAFAGGLTAVALVTRYALRADRGAPPTLAEPPTGWMAELGAAPITVDPSRPRIMLAARGRYQSEFAVDLARQRGATLFAIYVRTLRLIDVQPGKAPRIEDDRGAQEALGTTAMLARRAGIPFVPIYVTSPDIAEEILDYTVTYGCDTLILGESRRSFISRRLAGDVIAQVGQLLPEGVSLITRPSDVPYTPQAAGTP